MALAKQQFFFPFFLFVNSRYILPGPVYVSYDLSPLNGQLPDSDDSMVFGRSRRDSLQGIQSALQAQGELLPFCGRWKGSSPTPRASLGQSIPLAEHPSFHSRL